MVISLLLKFESSDKFSVSLRCVKGSERVAWKVELNPHEQYIPIKVGGDKNNRRFLVPADVVKSDGRSILNTAQSVKS